MEIERQPESGVSGWFFRVSDGLLGRLKELVLNVSSLVGNPTKRMDFMVLLGHNPTYACKPTLAQ